MESISGNALVMKEINVNLVRKVLRAKGQATKQQIAEATGLSIVTVGTVLQQLLKENEVFEAELTSSRGGRPAHQFRYNDNYAFSLILFPHEKDGFIMLHSTLVNLAGKCIHEEDEKVQNVNLACFEQMMDRMLSVYPSIRSIGFGIPGEEFDGEIIVSDYKELLGVSLVRYFETRYRKPVIVENDVNAAVIGFCKKQGLDEGRTVVYLYFPRKYPPGAGIFINGRLHKGKGNYAGEVANIPLDIPWEEDALYTLPERFCSAISKLIVAVGSLLNPDHVVVQGDFLQQAHLADIAQKCSAQLPQIAVPDILLSEDFGDDYLMGMIVQTLEAMEPNLVLSIK